METKDKYNLPRSPEKVSLSLRDSSAHPLKSWEMNKEALFSIWQQQQAVSEVAHADPQHVQEVAAAQLASMNSYYQSSVHQGQQCFRWAVLWGGVGGAFLLLAVVILLLRQPFEIGLVCGVSGLLLQGCAGIYLSLYKDASQRIVAFRSYIEKTQRLLLANSMCEQLEGEMKQTSRAEMIQHIVEAAVSEQRPQPVQNEGKHWPSFSWK